MKSKLRILHIIGGGEFGGAEQHIINLLTSFPKEDVEAAVVCFYDSVFAQKLREANIPVVALDQYGRFDLRLYYGLQKVLDSYQPDIIHSHGVKANFLTRLASIGKHKLLLTTVHSHLRYDYQSMLTFFIVSLMERSTRSVNTHFIAVSGALLKLLHAQGIKEEATSLIYNGLPLAPFQKHEDRALDRTKLLQEWSLPEDAFLFGTVARFVPVKGLPFLIKGFAQVASQDPQDVHRYRLVLVGDGPERAALEELVTSLEVRDRVRFTGFRQDIPVCLHAFDTFVHSSFYEGMGYTLIEAMASQVPVIATRVGGVGEIVFPDKTGLLVEPGSAEALSAAMLQMARDARLRDRVVREAERMVEEVFTIEKMAEKTLQLYQKLVNDRRLLKA